MNTSYNNSTSFVHTLKPIENLEEKVKLIIAKNIANYSGLLHKYFTADPGEGQEKALKAIKQELLQPDLASKHGQKLNHISYFQTVQSLLKNDNNVTESNDKKDLDVQTLFKRLLTTLGLPKESLNANDLKHREILWTRLGKWLTEKCDTDELNGLTFSGAIFNAGENSSFIFDTTVSLTECKLLSGYIAFNKGTLYTYGKAIAVPSSLEAIIDKELNLDNISETASVKLEGDNNISKENENKLDGFVDSNESVHLSNLSLAESIDLEDGEFTK